MDICAWVKDRRICWRWKRPKKERTRTGVWILVGLVQMVHSASDCRHCLLISQRLPPSQNPKKNIFRIFCHLASLLLKSLRFSEKVLASKCCQNWIIFHCPSSQYCELIGASNPDHRDRETSTTPGNVHHRDHRHGDGDGDNDDGCYDCQSNIKACKQDNPQT